MLTEPAMDECGDRVSRTGVDHARGAEKPAPATVKAAGACFPTGGADETRTRDLRRDRPAF